MVQGLFIRRISRRLAEVEVSGNTFEAYISNGIEMDFLKNESVCFLRKAENENRRSPFDLYSVYDGDTLVCVDTKEPLRIAEIWASKNLNNERGEKLSFYTDTKGMTLLAFGRENHDLMIQVMGTSFANDRAAYLPGIPSKALNERLESLLWMKDRGQDPHLLFVICRNDADCFYANQEIDPYFADLLDEVKEAGIPIEAVRCVVDEDGMTIDSIAPLR